ncbi:MAG: hypothetical protein BKP49_04315 [Treponema sp. CETP13]|nr:MAG: hypothetical protein BKP49_04315 [Treponema sp. CETP13]
MKQKNLYIVNFIVILTIFIMSCKSAPEHTTSIDKNFEPTGLIVIPFTYNSDEYMPVFTMSNSDGVKLRLCFDSGNSCCFISKKGIEKVGSNEKEMESGIFKQLLEKYPEQKESFLRKKAKKMIKEGKCGWTFDSLIKDNYKVENRYFQYRSNFIKETNIDGLIGLSFFGDCKNVVIDYVHQVIEIDAETLEGNKWSMTKVPDLDLYKTQISVNGIEQYALIDTGAKQMAIRKNYTEPDTMLDKDKVDFIYNGSAGLSFPWVSNTTFEFVNIQKRLSAYKSTNFLMHASGFGKRCAYVYNLLGYPFFCDTRIQFDFKNSQFIIE